MTDRITFSFGENWSDFLSGVTEEDLRRALDDIEFWLGDRGVEGKRVVDVGSGSGIHSLSFLQLGAESVRSFDFDPLSVKATARMREQYGSPDNWTVEHGSVLDSAYLKTLGTFDIAYSWGVLHHTGSMWEAIDNCASLVVPGGVLWISIYKKGRRYPKDLALKKQFNAGSGLTKKWLIGRKIGRRMGVRLRQGKNPFAWNQRVGRGMNVYHDIVDWLGGLPYETATEDEIVRFMRDRGFVLERIRVAPEGGCSIYVFQLPES